MAFQTFNPRTIAALFKLELDDMFDAWEAQKPLRTGAPHASAVLASEADWCVRRHVLSMLHPEQAERPVRMSWDTHKSAVFLNGWVLHEKWQKLFSDHGKVIEVETSHFDETRQLHFTPDAIVQFGNHQYVVEIKGYHTDHFEKLDEAGEPPQAAHCQANLYCHLLGIERGIVLVENKNTQAYKVWCIQHDPTLARVYTDRMYAVKGAVIVAQRPDGHLPPRKCESLSQFKACACPMRRVCFSKEG